MPNNKPNPTAKPKLTKSNTRVGYEQTVNEIQKHLIRAGAKKIIFDYDDAMMPCNITFSYPTPKGLMLFSLPLRFQGVSNILTKQKVHNRTGDLHPINTAWRIMKDWIVSQLAMVDAELAEFSEVFLPYAVTKTGETLFEQVSKMNDISSPLLLNQQ